MKKFPLVLAAACVVACATGGAQNVPLTPKASAPVDPAAADAAAIASRLSGAGMCRVHFNGDGRVARATMTRSTGSTILDEDTVHSTRRNWQGLLGTTVSMPVRYSAVPSDKSATIRYTTPIPEYPVWASRYHVSGTYLLQALFDAQGNLTYVNVLRSCGNKQLDDFTVRYATRHWKSTGGEESVLTFPITYLWREQLVTR